MLALHRRPDTPSDATFDGIDTVLLGRLQLTPERVLSADGDSFVTLLCRDEIGARRVLKYVSGASPDARRRLANETRLLTHLSARPPLRFLTRREDGPDYLVTDYDTGRLLRPERMDDDPTLATVADALVAFQTMRANPSAMGIVDREQVSTYYVKVLLKHLAHLWPAHISALEAIRSVRAVRAALPAILSRRVACHGDFLPTNLLYHADDRRVTFTDLEGFMTANHPLFDVLALFTIEDRDLGRWGWQPRFLRLYLEAGSASIGLDPRSRAFSDAYRGILIFFLVYRLNEARIGLAGTSYFDGLGRLRYLGRKAANVVLGRPEAWRQDAMAALEVRKGNLRQALSTKGYREHLEAMLAIAAA